MVVNSRRERGFSLVELLVATAIGTLLLSSLTSVARQSALSRSQTRDASEAMYQARFALQRVGLAGKAASPRSLLPPAANTSGDWFSPVYFCTNGSAALIETTTADTGCTGTKVIAEKLLSFSASVPAGTGPLDAASASVTITLTGPAGGASTVLSERIRLGGGVN